MKKILLIDDEEGVRFALKNILTHEGYSIGTAINYEEAAARLKQESFDLIIADILLGGKTGIDVLRHINEQGLTCPVIMLTGAPSIETASDAVRLGAYDYLKKPISKDALVRIVQKALDHKLLKDEIEKYRKNLEAIFASITEGIITFDREMNVLELNRAAEKICSISRDVIGRKLEHLVCNCEGSCLQTVKKTIETGKPTEIFGIQCGRKDGIKQLITVRTSPLYGPDSCFDGVVVVFQDETLLDKLQRDVSKRMRCQNIIGQSSSMQKVYDYIDRCLDVQSTVLITGESGTGKELIAEAIHYCGPRKNMPLVRVNCSAISESLLESELFGHVKGAFTGAISNRTGRFEMAEGGTIFLDEIGDISPQMQIRLLRVLQELQIERVGESSPINIDVRIIAATNADLKALVNNGLFREDLYYRLKVVEIHAPPLRERKDDIPLLVDHLVNKINRKLSKSLRSVSDDVIRMFMNYSWPGNIRELEHVLEHAMIVCPGRNLYPDTLPTEFINLVNDAGQFDITVQKNTKATIINALEKSGWNKAKAARLLGMSRSTLYLKLEEFTIQEP